METQIILTREDYNNLLRAGMRAERLQKELREANEYLSLSKEKEQLLLIKVIYYENKELVRRCAEEKEWRNVFYILQQKIHNQYNIDSVDKIEDMIAHLLNIYQNEVQQQQQQ